MKRLTYYLIGMSAVSIFICAFAFSHISAKTVLIPQDSDCCISSGNGKDVIKAGKMIDHTFKINSDFTSVETSCAVDVVFTQSSDNKRVVKGRLPENIIELMDIHVENGILHVGMKTGDYRIKMGKDKSVTLFIESNNLKSVTSTGSGDFKINGSLRVSDGFTLSSTGSGDFKIENLLAKGQSVSIDITGSGDADIKALEADDLTIQISGSGEVDCAKIDTQNCSVSISGSGEAELSGKSNDVKFIVAGSGEIDASKLQASSGKAIVSGSGDIRCDVKNLDKSVAGSGSISNR